LFVPELEALIDAYLARAYHARPHDGLRLPHIPHRELSPNEMYDALIGIGGCIYVPPSRDIYFDLLPTAWRTIQPYGVEVLGLIYDDVPDADERVLDPLRYTRSPYGGRRVGEWPIRYDPRDLSRVFAQDPGTGVWGVLPWRHAVGPERPFTDSLLAVARRIAAAELAGARPPKALLAKIVNGLVDEAQDRARVGRDTRRASRDRLRTAQAAYDRPAPELSDPPSRADVTPEPTPHPNGDSPTPLVIEPLPSALEELDD
jgi:hypothetical protein